MTSFASPVQPFSPDFWESSRAKAAAAAALPEEPHVPKVILIAGDSARADSVSVPVREHDSLELLHHTEHSATAAAPNVSNVRSLFLDVADDLVLPKDLSAFKPLRGRLPQPDDLIDGTSSATSRFHTRTLDKGEVKGLWIIFGLFAGSWLAGGLLKKESKYTV